MSITAAVLFKHPGNPQAAGWDKSPFPRALRLLLSPSAQTHLTLRELGTGKSLGDMKGAGIDPPGGVNQEGRTVGVGGVVVVERWGVQRDALSPGSARHGLDLAKDKGRTQAA